MQIYFGKKDNEEASHWLWEERSEMYSIKNNSFDQRLPPDELETPPPQMQIC